MTTVLFALFAALPSPALAADKIVDPFTEADEDAAFRLEEEMVTVASSYAQTVREAPSIVTVISDRDIRERGYLTLADALRSIPGIYLSTSPEGLTLAWFRGVVSADNNKILLLMDGVPWYDGIYTNAWVDEYVALENVRQIEVIKGPGSAIYGTNAFAGVINVVTYKADDLEGGFLRASAGSAARFGGALVAADHVFTDRKTPVSVSAMARFLDMDGDGLDVTPKGERNVTGTDPRRAVNAGFHIDYGPLYLGFDSVDYRHTYLTLPQDDTLDVLVQSVDEFNMAYKNQFLTARYRLDLGRHLELTPQVFYQYYDNSGNYAWFEDPEIVETDGVITTSWPTTMVEAVKKSARYGASADLKAHPTAMQTLVGGLGMEFTDVIALEDLTFSGTTGEPSEDGFRIDPRRESLLWDAYVYVQDTWAAQYWLEVVGGLRVDYHSIVGGVFPSPRAGLLFVPNARTTVKLLYGRAFRAPTARELLVVVDQDEEGYNKWTAGNQKLEHERIDTIEAEIMEVPASWLHLRGAVFYSGVANEIDKRTQEVPNPALGDAYYDNFDGANVVGAELETTVSPDPFELGASLAWTHGVDRTTGNAVYEFPPLMGHGRATVHLTDALRASLMADLYGKRPRREWSPDADLKDGPAFALLDVAVASNLVRSGRLRVDVSVRNLLDTDFETLIYRDDANEVRDGEPRFPEDIAGKGRSITVGLEGDF